MNTVKFFLLFSLLNSFALLHSQEKMMHGQGMRHMMNDNGKQEEDQKKSCQCYCAYLPGFRKAHEGDTPFYDKESGLCFCARRDKEKYESEVGKDRNNDSKLLRDLPSCCNE
jgi:hypothetical protein